RHPTRVRARGLHVERAARGLPALLDAALQVLRGERAPGESYCDALADLVPMHAVRDDAARARQLARPIGDALGVAPKRARDHVRRGAKYRLSPYVDDQWRLAAANGGQNFDCRYVTW